MQTKNIFQKLITTFILCLFTFSFAFSCSSFELNNKDNFSISIPRTAFAKDVLGDDTECVLVKCTIQYNGGGDTQTSTILQNTENITFNFNNLPTNKNINVTVELYKGALDNIIYKGSTQTILTSTNNTIQLNLNAFDTANNFDKLLSQKLFNGELLQKTTEVVVVPHNSFGHINMSDDSSWNSYYNAQTPASIYKGVFISGRNVKLSPYAIGQYEVTQELYHAVTKSNPSFYDGSTTKEPVQNEIQKYRPVEFITWYQTIAFCNELTKKTMTSADCVYYTDDTFSTLYTLNDATSNTEPFLNPNKKGYRLPTEAEWEFAARDGDPLTQEWKYAFAGSQSQNAVTTFVTDENLGLNDYGWYTKNAINNSKVTHQVGLKLSNTLGLYDMSGNVYEWCYDWCVPSKVIDNDREYIIDNIVTNPLGITKPESNAKRSKRGGDCSESSYYCSVSYRNSDSPIQQKKQIGFRLARWL